jgi:hypothetical protein
VPAGFGFSLVYPGFGVEARRAGEPLGEIQKWSVGAHGQAAALGRHAAHVDLDTGQRTQTWLAVSDEPAALVSGRYWHNLRQQEPAAQATDPEFQDELIASLRKLTGVALPESYVAPRNAAAGTERSA